LIIDGIYIVDELISLLVL